MVSGPLFDHLKREGIILGVTGILSGVCNILIPFVNSLWPLVIIHALQGISFGAVDAGGSVCLIRIHGDLIDPWMQAMHFFFALGTTVSPFVIGMFIDKTGTLMESFIIFGVLTTVCGVIFLFVPPFKSIGKTEEKPVEMEDKKEEDGKEEKKEGGADLPDNNLVPRGLFWSIVILSSVFLCAYATIEIVFGAYIATYVIQAGFGDEVKGSYMTSVFFGLFCAGRLVAILKSFKMTPFLMMTVATVETLLVAIPMFGWRNETLMWILCGAYGFFMGPIWASLFNIISKDIELTGVAATIIVLGSSVGDLIFTVTIGNLMSKYGPDVLTGQQLISTLVQVLVYIPLVMLLRKAGKYSHKSTATRVRKSDKLFEFS